MRVYKIVTFSVVILLITVLFAGAATVPATAQTDTMQFRYNAQHTGDYSPVAGPVPSNGKLLWNYTTGSSIESSPAFANGIVYVGSDDGNVYALNATTGSKMWNYNTTAGPIWYSSPAVVNGVVYEGSRWNNNVNALNATTGAKLWSYTTGSAVFSSPAVVSGFVYVGSYDSIVYALNAITGSKMWNYTITGASVFSSPAYANGVVYVGSFSNYFYALNAITGAKLWSFFNPRASMSSSAAIANGVVYVAGNDQILYALNASTGTNMWNYTIGSAPQSVPAVVNGVVYVGGSDNVYALNSSSGTKLWNYTTGGSGSSSPAYANGVVYVGSDDNNTYALNATTGSKLWNYTTGGHVDSSPAVVNGVVYVGSGDGNLYAIGTESVSKQTTLSVVINPTTVVTKQQFNVTGMLNTTSGTPIAGATIQLQKNVSGTWQNVNGKANTTTSTGAYRMSTSESAPGTYQYRTTYAGNATYAGTNSSSVTVTVNKIPTQLSASANPTTVYQQLTVNGTLNTTEGTPIAGATIQLQKNVSGTWTNVMTNVTNETGGYAFSQNEIAVGVYYYRTIYDGSTSYVNATSNVVTVTVVSKASVLADLNALSLTVLGTPNSAFIPGTKIATLAEIGAAKVNFMVGSYGGATTELKSSLLPRMDGCAKTGKPDGDDWVRTCTAQGQLYPQVQNLIQELQAVQG